MIAATALAGADEIDVLGGVHAVATTLTFTTGATIPLDGGRPLNG